LRGDAAFCEGLPGETLLKFALGSQVFVAGAEKQAYRRKGAFGRGKPDGDTIGIFYYLSLTASTRMIKRCEKGRAPLCPSHSSSGLFS